MEVQKRGCVRSRTTAVGTARLGLWLLMMGAAWMAGCDSQKETSPPETTEAAGGSGEGTAESKTAEAKGTPAKPKNPPMLEGWEKPDLLLVLTGEQKGFIEPCGCSETQSGGFSRRADFFNQIHKKGWETLPLDLGETLKRSRPQDQIKFESILKGLSEMHYGALGLGRSEIRIGADRLLANHQPDAPEGIPFVSANIILFDTPDLGTPLRYKVIERNGIKVAVTSILGKTYSEEVAPPAGVTADYKIEAAEKVLPEVIKQMMEEKPDLMVLLSQATEKESEELAKQFPEFQIVVTAEGVEDGEIKPREIGKTWVVVAGAKGKHLAAIGYFKSGPMKYELIELDNQRFGETPQMRELMKAYQDQLQSQEIDLNVTTIAHTRETGFVGAQKCGECHTKAFAKWKSGEMEPVGHARAFRSLKEGRPGQKEGWVSRIHDPECLACHVTGWNSQEVLRFETGFVSEEKTPHLMNQQCENCHGPGERHSQLETDWKKTLKMSDAILASRKEMHLDRAVAKDKTCFQCHDHENSPKFDFDKYWAKIAHPGRD